jgi:UDP-N-acetylmuramate dehydrogenase
VIDRLADELTARLGPAVRRDAPLGALTTYRVGGTASLLVDVGSEDDLRAVRDSVLTAGAREAVRILVLGKGSNLLVADAGFDGLVVRLGAPLGSVDVPGPAGTGAAAANDRTDSGRVVVRAGGAAGLPVLARKSAEAGLTGLEWAVGIPGSVGGALKMNAGGHGSDTASCLVAYRWIDVGGGCEEGGEAGPERLGLGYRTSALGATEVVVWADLAARRGDPMAARATIAEIVRWRREHQPGGSNAGSVFTNPDGDSAGRLVDEAGLKGFRLGSARVSEKHANFIQADDGGKADDVLALMAHVRREVAAATGVLLRPEVRLVGFGARPLGDWDGPGSGR